MSLKTSAELRKAFIEFFSERRHVSVDSAPLVPNDPDLMFTVAGMVPFKPYFLGLEPAPWPRAVSVQKCLRAGGKHNDLDEVGHTNQHLSFFEMLGNFSFGDYFKPEAIEWSWEFSTEVLGLNPDQLWVTVHESDDEAEDLWRKYIAKDRIQRLDEDNYWRMGENGPCGPCSEIFMDKGRDYGRDGGPASQDSGRYVEFWNLVFMQFDQQKDGSLVPLPSPSIDTGAGLERLLAVINNVDSVFEVGDLAKLVKKAEKLTGVKYGSSDTKDTSLRIIAEHLRSASFLVSEGILPSNEGRGYVLRRLLRRAIRHSHLLGAEDKKICPALARETITTMGDDYPELVKSEKVIVEAVEREESSFRKTLNSGLETLLESMDNSSDQKIAGSMAFKLHDTYGFPLELTQEISGERGFSVDMEGFTSEMNEQKTRARAARHSGKDELGLMEGLKNIPPTKFVGDEIYETEAEVLFVHEEGVVLDKSPFYAESGGQVGDTGFIIGKNSRYEVMDTTYITGNIHFHHLESPSDLQVGKNITAAIDGDRREAIRRHHTGTHILHWALRTHLGEHVTPQGCLVDEKHLRFDFSHWEALSREDIEAIEDLANSELLKNEPVRHFETSLEEAKAMGALSFFGEKYGEKVKVLEAGSNSLELCGGTHVRALGDIGLIKIVSEGSSAANIRRVEAICGDSPIHLIRDLEDRLSSASEALNVSPDNLVSGIEKRLKELQAAKEELGQIKSEEALGRTDDLMKSAVDGIIVERLDGMDNDILRKMTLKLKDKKNIKCVVLGSVFSGSKVGIVAAAGEEMHAGDLLKDAAKLISGGAGNGADLAVAGGKNTEGLDEALTLVREAAQKQLTKE